MTHSSRLHGSISLSQDELRDKFVSEDWYALLKSKYVMERTDTFAAGFDHWKNTLIVRKEIFRDPVTKARMALIYWSKDGKDTPTVMSMCDGVCKYQWNGKPAT